MKRSKEDWKEVERLASLLLQALTAKTSDAFKPFQVYAGGSWHQIGAPVTWIGAEDWEAASYKERLQVLQVHLYDKLRHFYRFTNVPEEYKLK